MDSAASSVQEDFSTHVSSAVEVATAWLGSTCTAALDSGLAFATPSPAQLFAAGVGHIPDAPRPGGAAAVTKDMAMWLEHSVPTSHPLFMDK